MTSSKLHRTILLFVTPLLFSVFLQSCVSIPKGAAAIQPFDQEGYLGKWYEVARLDFKWERNLNNTTATYSLRDDGLIKVDNQGYNTVEEEWTQAIGRAKFVGSPDIARLKVSFFGPFFGGYKVIALDDDYQYALVSGSKLKNLWILSRETTIPDHIRTEYLDLARSIGFDVDALLWVEHDKHHP